MVSCRKGTTTVGKIDKTKMRILDRPHKDVFNAQKIENAT